MNTKQLSEQFGESFHSCLRKAMDSDWSCIAWNLIHIIEPAVWSQFCKEVSAKIASWPEDFTIEDVKRDVFGWKSDKYTHHEICFEYTLKLADEHDIQSCYYWFKV